MREFLNLYLLQIFSYDSPDLEFIIGRCSVATLGAVFFGKFLFFLEGTFVMARSSCFKLSGCSWFEPVVTRTANLTLLFPKIST